MPADWTLIVPLVTLIAWVMWYAGSRTEPPSDVRPPFTDRDLEVHQRRLNAILRKGDDLS